MSGLQMTDTFSVDPVGTAFMCFLYMGVGIVSTLCNLVNLAVFFSTKEFREKYLFYIILDLGELVNAIAYIVTGQGRLRELWAGELTEPHSVAACFFQHPWPILLILGMELVTITIVILSLERICAVVAPIQFKNFFLSPCKWLIVLVIPAFGLTSLVIAGYSAMTDRSWKTATGHCGIITSTSQWFSTFHFTFIMFAYMSAFWSCLFVWHTFRGRSHGTRKLRVMVVLVGISAVLVSIPSLINIFMRFGLFDLSDFYYSISYSLPGFLSIANTVVNFSLRPDVRRRFLVLFLRRHNLTLHYHHEGSSSSTHHTTQTHPIRHHSVDLHFPRHNFLHHN